MHNHNHSHKYESISVRLFITFSLNILITIAEIIGGIISGSLSLISDALHNFSDGISVVVSYIAIKLKQREHSPKHTFGLKRAEILAALINSAVLIIISLYLFYEAILRFNTPNDIKSSTMIIVASVGLFANIIGTLLLKKDSKESINIKSAYFHLLSDVFSSIAVIIGGLAIFYWQVFWVDPLLTILIGIYILKESYSILMQALHVLMEGAPKHIKVEEIKNAVEEIDEILDIHHLHLWSVGESDIHIEAHVNVNDMMVSTSDNVRRKIEDSLLSNFGINHVTLQFECNQCEENNLIHNEN